MKGVHSQIFEEMTDALEVCNHPRQDIRSGTRTNSLSHIRCRTIAHSLSHIHFRTFTLANSLSQIHSPTENAPKTSTRVLKGIREHAAHCDDCADAYFTAAEAARGVSLMLGAAVVFLFGAMVRAWCILVTHRCHACSYRCNVGAPAAGRSGPQLQDVSKALCELLD